MGHIQQLAFALGPAEARPAAPVRSRPGGRATRPGIVAAQPLLLPECPSAITPAGAVDDAAAAAPPPPTAPAPAVPAVATPEAAPPPRPSSPPFSAARPLLSDGDAPSPVKATLYLVIGFARGRERRRSGWQRLTEQGFASRRLAEEHAARLLARGRADGAVLARQNLAADMDAADEPELLARFGDLPVELLEI